MIARLWQWMRAQRELHVSSAWLKHQDRREMRIEWHSAPFSWPINKSKNERAWLNTKQLRRRA